MTPVIQKVGVFALAVAPATSICVYKTTPLEGLTVARTESSASKLAEAKTLPSAGAKAAATVADGSTGSTGWDPLGELRAVAARLAPDHQPAAVELIAKIAGLSLLGNLPPLACSWSETGDLNVEWIAQDRRAGFAFGEDGSRLWFHVDLRPGRRTQAGGDLGSVDLESVARAILR
jgi:hypothetical protein